MGVTRSAIPVRFHGEDGSDAGELTWGQQEIWETMQRTGRTLNIGGALPMPAGTTAEEMATMLRFWVTRHPSLRTRLRFAPHPQQVVALSGELPLHVLDVDGADDPVVAAEALRVEFETPAFDYENEFPVRMGVVRRAGEVTHMVVQYCHLAVDGGGIDAMIRDLENLDQETGEGTAPADALTPLELARIQSTPAGLRPSRKSLRHWREQLRDVPSRRFAEPGEGCEPRFWELCLYSPAMYLALKSIAARTETNTTHVLFAAYAVALAQVTGVQPSLAMTVVSNRFRPGLGDLVGHISQPGLCVVEVADCTFDEVVLRAWKAVTAGALHGYYEPAARRAMLEQLAEERGEPIDTSCFINDRRRDAEPQPGEVPATEQELRAALAKSTLRWDRKLPVFDETLFLQVDSGPDLNAPRRIVEEESQHDPAVFLAAWADTRYLPPRDVEAFLTAMEQILVRAALNPDTVTDVKA